MSVRKKAASAVLLGGMIAHCAPVAAQDEAVQAGDILVTAQRREQVLRDIPISISVIDREAIELQRINELQDYVALLPNVTFNTEGSSSAGQALSIRGITNIGGAVNSIAVYVDEFNVTPSDTGLALDTNLFDIERIEVLRGPQGTYFGRNALGGAINITTRKPVGQFEAELFGELANFASHQLRGMVNVPLSENVFLRATGLYARDGGFLKDVGPANATNDETLYGGRLALRAISGDRLTIDVWAAHLDRREGRDDAVAADTLNFVLRSIGIDEPINPGIGFYPQNMRLISTNRPFERTNQTTTVVGRLSYDLGGAELVANGGYIKSRATAFGDADNTALDAYNDDVSGTLESTSVELRVQSSGNARTFWVIGALAAEDRSEIDLFREINGDFFLLFGLPPEFTATIPSFPVTNRVTRDRIRSYGLFGDLSWKTPDERLNLSAGLRYSRDSIDQSINFRRTFAPGIPPVEVFNQDSSGDATFNLVSGRLSALYALTPSANLYGTVSLGRKPGGFNLAPPLLPGTPATYDSERLINYEAGVKLVGADGRFRLNAALFYLDWNDIQVFTNIREFTPGGAINIIQITQNGAKASNRGFELDTDLAVTPWLRLSGAVGYSDARFDRFPNALSQTGEDFDASGNRLPLASRWTVNASAELSLPLNGDWSARVIGSLYHRSSFFETVENRPDVEDFVGGFETVDLRAFIEGRSLSIGAWAENLFNSRHYLGSRGDESLAGAQLVISPRRFGMSVRYRWR